MWQNIIVVIIVGVAAFYVIRQIVRSVTGRRACSCGGCDGCPLDEGCTEKEHEEPS